MGCGAVAITNVTIYGGSSMGVVESGGDGANTYTNFRIVRRPATWAGGKRRLLAVNGTFSPFFRGRGGGGGGGWLNPALTACTRRKLACTTPSSRKKRRGQRCSYGQPPFPLLFFFFPPCLPFNLPVCDTWRSPSPADGFHSDGNNLGPRLLDSEISYTGDDLGNICSAMSVLLSLNGTNEALMMDATTTNLVRGKPGDVVSFYNISFVDTFLGCCCCCCYYVVVVGGGVGGCISGT